jgi:hypothetical protein
MSEKLEYAYKARPALMLGVIAFFGACAAFMIHAALTNDRGLIIKNLFLKFSPEGATIFYWCVATVSVIFVLLAIAAVISGLANPTSVCLTSTELHAPKNGFSKKRLSIPLHSVQSVQIQTVQKQRFMTIYHSAGKLSIAQSLMPSAAAFDELHQTLLTKLAVGVANKTMPTCADARG